MDRIRFQVFLVGLLSLPLWLSHIPGADHGDTPLLKQVGRHDARLTDLFAFVEGSHLVLAACLDPTIPSEVTDYQFASDLVLQISIDNRARVRFDNPDDLETFGGTIQNPSGISPRITLTVTFDSAGEPKLKMGGLPESVEREIALFAGLRDDPFIRGPRIGRNIAAVVLEVPLDPVLDRNGPLLIWATSKVDDINGPFVDFMGRALRSQFPENDLMNTRPPSEHFTALSVTPDVLIFDTSEAAAFPNGRALQDDVVDLVGDARILQDDDPFPQENDVPFLNQFPYLGEPHSPK